MGVQPWRVPQLNHLQILSSGGIPLALAMLARGHGMRQGMGSAPARPGWALAGWLTATWQVSLGFGLGLHLGYLLAVCTAVAAARSLLAVRRGAASPSRRLLAADAVGLVLFVGLSGLLALPYFAAVEDHESARRTVAEATRYSPSAAALVTAPADSLMWGAATVEVRADVNTVKEKALLPGLTVTVLAVVGLSRGRWSRRRVVVLGAGVVVLALLSLGLAGPFAGRAYLLLYEHAPGWQGVRTPGRLVTTAWLLLALLAAHGVSVLQSRVRRRAAVAVGVALAALALVGGVDTAPRTVVRPAPSVALATLPQGAMLTADQMEPRLRGGNLNM